MLGQLTNMRGNDSISLQDLQRDSEVFMLYSKLPYGPEGSDHLKVVSLQKAKSKSNKGVTFGNLR